MKIKNQILSFIAIVAVALTTFSCTSDSPKEVTPLKSIIDIAKADPANFSILVDALKKTGLDGTLGNAGSYTVFAPTNAAFTAAGFTSASINALVAPADNVAIANLKLVLQNHVIGLGTKANDLVAGGYFKTFGFLKTSSTSTSGANLSVFVRMVGNDVILNGGIANGGAKVTTADAAIANNGIIHIIDAVLKLPTIVDQIKSNPNLSSLLAVVTSAPQASVLTTLNGATGSAAVTVYAPDNGAFTTATATGGYLVGKTDAQVINILRYHLESGNRAPSSTSSYSSSDLAITTLNTPNKFTILAGTVKIKDVVGTTNGTVKTFNIQGTNGVIQIVDKVLQPFL
ncbi:fasciclin domain-containing protein [Flavobacterium frigoris]|uniref:Uncaracterized surface protein containing fasciclin (FAS1) repeats n=1 Tax=Flavobacterium frigoris TaxID=229204 RepID=A0A1H9D6A3_FLAFI|nr:fasciclin domain-containing protein [Flavobacterium frigoris]SEQ08877.1 Uncaracterized surface protein containing fasciclin (FAS1) repeats [Flavobacterium frigoris]